MVEFVSANPTGPLHVGHGRAATIGDVLASILAANGWAAYREFYYNDAGEQINMLTQSVQARARQVGTPDYPFPEKGYQGSYIGELAQSFLSQGGDADDAEAIRKFAVAALRQVQDDDLQAYRVKFDHYFLESSLYTEGKVEATVQRLKANGKTYELDGALWLKTSDYGDDKDRVMLRSDGKGYTYFVPDIAYHQSKFERGFHRVITELGADHHGSLARVRAGLQALEIGVPEGFPDYVLHQMVMVVRDGQEVKFSKRAGDYYTLRDLIDEVGVDVVRFFFLMRKHDSQLTFDLDLAKKQSEENPVYYVQYAHARHCQVLAKVGTQSGVFRAELLHSKHEIALTRLLADYPDAVRAACSELSPHLLVNYVRELAAQFHSYYNAEQFLVANADLQTSRLRLVACCGQVIRGALALLGVSAPERM
jgi:arginyl-tRNA synthetase